MTTPSTLTLTDFLLARIAEREADPWGELEIAGADRVVGPAERDALRADEKRWVTFVLAECEAKRRIVEKLTQQERRGAANIEASLRASGTRPLGQEEITSLRTHGWELSGRLVGLRYAVAELALPYADHEDFNPEWRP